MVYQQNKTEEFPIWIHEMAYYPLIVLVFDPNGHANAAKLLHI